MLISPGSTCFVSSSNIDQGGGGGGRVGAKRELIFHTSDRSLVQKQSFLNNFVQDCRAVVNFIMEKIRFGIAHLNIYFISQFFETLPVGL